MAMLSYAVNVFLFTTGRIVSGQPPLLDTGGPWTDPLPQALVLTAGQFSIVASFHKPTGDNGDGHGTGCGPCDGFDSVNLMLSQHNVGKVQSEQGSRGGVLHGSLSRA
jgi:hypothetical protein